MKALVTRPRDDAASLATALSSRGIDPLIAPLLSINPLPDATQSLAAKLPGVQALLFTSANGARAFAASSSVRDLPVLAVGDATARAATKAGFTAVESAAGDVHALAQLAKARLTPGTGALLHPAASDVAGDLAGDLTAAGFTVRRAVIYRAEAAATLNSAARQAIAAGDVGYALFFSPRTAATFVTLARDAGLASRLGVIVALGLSTAVTAALAPLAWRGIEAAESPTETGLLAALDRSLKRNSTP